MNASPAMETGGPLLCFGASVDAALADGLAEVAVDELLEGPGRRPPAPGELLSGSRAVAGRGHGELLVRLEYRRAMEIAVVGATARVAVRRRRDRRRAGSRSRHSRRRSSGWPTERRWSAATAARGRSRRRRRASPPRRGRSPTSALGRLPQRDGGVIGAPAIEVAIRRARGEDVPIPASQRARWRLEMKVARALNVNGIRYPVEIEPHASLLDTVRRRDRADRRQGGLRRLRVRRLHDAARRPAGELVLVPGAAGRGARDHDRRGARAAGRAARCSRRSWSTAACSAGSARRGC